MKRIENGEWFDAAATMTPLAAAVTGAFETLRVRGAGMMFWREHWSRFHEGCRWFGLALPVSERELYDAANAVLRHNRVADGVLRFAAWHNGTQVRWRVEASGPRPHMRQPEFAVSVARTPLPPPSPDRAYKHLAREHWLAALREARATGYDETLLADARGQLVEGAVSNVFVVRNGRVHTPDLASGPLPGVMRAQALAMVARCGLDVAEMPLRLDDALAADELWLTNSLVGVRPVSRLENRSLPVDRPVLERLRALWTKELGWDPGLLPPE